jgi:hypothetical protein
MVLPWRMIKGAEPGAGKAASPVLNGGDEETCRWECALSLSNLNLQEKKDLTRTRSAP